MQKKNIGLIVTIIVLVIISISYVIYDRINNKNDEKSLSTRVYLGYEDDIEYFLGLDGLYKLS